MPSFGENSLNNLGTCHTDLQKIAHLAIRFVDFSVVEGHRGQADQNRMADEGKSHLRWPDGRHNTIPSKAMDIVPWPAGYDERAMLVLAGAVRLAADILLEEGEIGHGLRWGGDWDGDGDFRDNRLWDPWHFELESVP